MHYVAIYMTTTAAAVFCFLALKSAIKGASDTWFNAALAGVNIGSVLLIFGQ